MQYLFSLRHSDKKNVIEVGAFMQDGITRLYFGIITNEEEWPSILKSDQTQIEPVKLGHATIYCFPNVVKEKFTRTDLNVNEQLDHNTAPSISETLSQPTIINAAQCAKLIRRKKVLLTGAGISKASGVPDMNQLQSMIEDIFGDKDAFILDVIHGTDSQRLDQVEALRRLLFLSEPADVHWKINELIKQHKYQLVTGNLDGLHEKTGIQPLFFTQSNQKIEDLHQYDVLLTIGLGDEGMLGLADQFKKHNSQGIVIAINLEQPKYIQTGDYFVFGDCEDEVASLVNELNL